MQQDVILVLDLGSEENPKIAREIRALGVYSEIHPHDLTAAELGAIPNIRGVILNGGKNRIVDGAAIDASEAVYALNVPILAVDHAAKVGETLPAWPEDDAARAAAHGFHGGIKAPVELSRTSCKAQSGQCSVHFCASPAFPFTSVHSS